LKTKVTLLDNVSQQLAFSLQPSAFGSTTSATQSVSGEADGSWLKKADYYQLFSE